jgi:hypothetical protein
MSVLFAITCLFSAFNLVFMPFHPVMMLWAFGLSVAFIIVNIIADRLRLWSGIAWAMAAAVIVAFMLNGAEPNEENRVLISTFACLASAWYAGVQFRRERVSVLTGILSVSVSVSVPVPCLPVSASSVLLTSDLTI